MFFLNDEMVGNVECGWWFRYLFSRYYLLEMRRDELQKQQLTSPSSKLKYLALCIGSGFFFTDIYMVLPATLMHRVNVCSYTSESELRSGGIPSLDRQY
jgi:hypothetical protein